MAFFGKCRNYTSKTTSVFSKFLLFVQLFFVLLLVVWFVKAFISSYVPHPLNNRLPYLGKKDYGGIIFGDSEPGSTYYYGTETQDIKGLFKNAEYVESDPEYDYTTIDFAAPTGDFNVDIYSNNEVFNAPNIPHTYTLAIDASDYRAAKAALTR